MTLLWGSRLVIVADTKKIAQEHDRRTGRNPRHWIDMDDETFKEKIHEVRCRIDAIDTFIRPNAMAKYVKYAD